MTDDYREGGTLILARPIGPSEPKKESGGEACLVNLHPPGPDIGKRVPLLNKQYIVGRDSEAGFVVSRSSVSRQHARLYTNDDGQWWVEGAGGPIDCRVVGSQAARPAAITLDLAD